MAESAPLQTPIAEADKIAAAWAKLRMGHEAVMLQDAAEVLRTNRGVVKAHSREFLGPSWQEPGEDGVIHIGDVNQTVPQQTAPQAAPAALGALAKIGLAFAISGPIGAGIAAIPVIQSWLSKPAAVAPAVPSPNPQTLYDLRLGGN